MAHFHQFAGFAVEDCIEHYNGEFLLGTVLVAMVFG
jgi:hypothetical protein